MLKIHNSLTGTKEAFIPIEPGHVRMYVCGMTVYDYCHIGHARVMVVFDMVTRYLRARGLKVTYVRNITDIDDKIIKRAQVNNEPMGALTDRYIEAMHEDAAALGVLPSDMEPRATASMEAIIAMIETLENKGYAYRANNGDVYYDVSRFEPYGVLSGKRLEDLRAGERVAVDEAKDDPLDFVLWKAAKPGEPSWPSSFGPGRPGWHIECSAMSTQCLGEHFDIHGGGMDLKFPHHENEIAQSEGATGHKFVNIWMHNGFVQINEEKMSKSLGNFFTVRQVIEHYEKKYGKKEIAGEIIRFFILNSHYRSPLNYSDQNLDAAKSALDRLYTTLREVPPVAASVDGGDFEVRFNAAMDDDFNTPDAIAVLFDLARELNRAKDRGDNAMAQSYSNILRQLGGIVGILQIKPRDWFESVTITPLTGKVNGAGNPKDVARGLSEQAIEELIEQRNVARKAKNFAESDRIRDQLKAAGIILEDRPDGTSRWRRG